MSLSYGYLRLNRLKQHGIRKDLRVDDFPISGPIVDELSPQHAIIRKLVLEDGRAVRYRNGVYMFVPQCASWVHVRSPEAAKYLANMLDLSNVSVNYIGATQTYASYAELLARPCRPVPPSVCISSWRFHVTLKEVGGSKETGKLYFRPVFRIIDEPQARKRVTSLVISPVRISLVPGNSTTIRKSPAEIGLSNVMTSEDLYLTMWVVGNGLLDPVDRPKALYLYGGGGEGKSTTINTILANLPGAVHPLGKDYVGGSSHISEYDLSCAMSSKFISYGDVVITNNKINAPFWKMITGNDTVRVAEGQGRLGCTSLFASNDLWYPKSSLLKRWFVRRTIVVSLGTPSVGSKPPPEAFTDVEVYDFVSKCVYIRLKEAFIPITVRSILLTIFGYRVGVATRGIILGSKSTGLGSIAATWSLSIAGQIEYDLLVDLVKASCPEMIGKHADIEFIRNIQPAPPTVRLI